MTWKSLFRSTHPRASCRSCRPVQLRVEALEAREVPTATAFVLPVNSAVATQAILRAGDSVGAYRMAGTPDGLGAFDNGDGTFTVLMNHEFTDAEGVAHTHNASLGTAGKGALVSEWVIDKATLTVLNGRDLIQTLIDGTTFQ